MVEKSWVPAGEMSPLVLVSGSGQLRDEVARVAAAAGLGLTVAATVAEALLLRPAVLLVGSGSVSGRVAPGADYIVVGLAGDEEGMWETAARLEAARVAVLPQASGWLVDQLGRLQVSRAAGHVVAVMGSAGGAGTSTLSCWLALHSAAQGRTTLLIDGDPFGGGLELAVGAESSPGVRWEDLGEVRGTLSPDQLARSLPSVGGFALLSKGVSRDPGLLASPAVPPVMDAAKNAFDLTVVDVSRGWSPEESLLPFCDSVLLTIPGRTRAIAAARFMVPLLQPMRVSAIVRGPLGANLDPERVAEAAGCHLAAYLPQLRGVAGAEIQGRLLDAGGMRAVRRMVRDALATLPTPTPAAV